MANLLFALQGIIGPDPPESTELSPSEGEEPLCDTSDASHLLPGAVEGTVAVHDEDMKHLLGHGGDSPGRPQPQDGSDILESVRDVTDDTSDSDVLEDEKRNLSSPPGLLSPVQIGTVPPVPFPHAGLDAVLACDVSIDSDSPEAWVGPIPLSRSPPQLNQPGSTLDLLSFPFGSPVSRVLPRRLSSSATWKQCGLPTLRDPPPISTANSQRDIPSAENSSFMPASQVWHSPLHSFPLEQEVVEDAIPSDGMASESDLSVDVSNSPPTERRLISIPSSNIPVLRSPIPMTSYEKPLDAQLAITAIPNEDPLGDREEYMPTVLEGTVGSSPVPSQLPSMGVEANHPGELLPHPTLTVDIPASSTRSTYVSEHSPISPGETAEATEFDYEALYQSLVMSPEEAASKRMSWVSRSSPPRASPVGTLSVPAPTVMHTDALGRSHSAVDLSRSNVAPPLLSDNTSRTSSPLLETPESSGSSQADASTQSIQVCTSSTPDSTTSPVASTSSLISPKLTRPPAEKLPLRSLPIAGPSGEVKSLLNDLEPAKSMWNSVSTSRKVPFGFRNSITVR